MQAHRFLKAVTLALAAASVVACAGSGRPAGQTAASTANLPGKPGCFFIANIRGPQGASWTVVDDSTLIMKVPAVQSGTPYLIKLMFPVFDLPLHLNLGFQDIEHTGQICNDSHDSLIVPHYQPATDPILAIRQLTPDEAASLLKSHGKAKAVASKGG